ncbi:hypothetical protein H3285_31610, partial [Escherichia coli]|nr:hypothetical protein [Escherichia coli]
FVWSPVFGNGFAASYVAVCCLLSTTFNGVFSVDGFLGSVGFDGSTGFLGFKNSAST